MMRAIQIFSKPKKVRVNKNLTRVVGKLPRTWNVVVDGFRFDLEQAVFTVVLRTRLLEVLKYKLIDADVESMYPNIAISNRVYPEHLTEKLCDIS